MNNRNDDSSRMPENDPSKAMDSKKEVERSNDEKIDQDFPGYPNYTTKEDIMDQRTDAHRVDMDVENLPANRNATGVNQRFSSTSDRERTDNSVQPQQGSGEDDLDIQMGTEADVSDDDLAVLNSTDQEIGIPQNISNEDLEDLDVPGSDLDDENESIGEEDEENNYYSLGGDRHEGQEEDPYSDPNRGND